MLKINNLIVKNKNKTLLNNINFSVEKGEVVGILGQSGSGKTLLSSAITGLLTRDLNVSGDIIFNGINLLKIKEKQLAKLRGKNIGLVFQNAFSAFLNNKKILEEFTEIFAFHKLIYDENKVIEVLKSVDISSDELKKYPHQFSGGQLQRILIALFIVLEPELIIYDESTTGLDMINTKKIIDIINRLKADNNTAQIIISHDIDVIKKVADRIIVMSSGKIVEENTKYEILYNPKTKITKMLLEARL